jgi:2'-5' RNA ligase
MARLRTFIGIPIDKGTRVNLLTLQETLAEVAPDVKWVEPENLHLTLLFLGEVDDREVHSVCRVVADVCASQPPFSMSLEKAGSFGNPRRPRTLWVGVGAGAQEVCALHDALEPPLLDLGCYRREERAYTPHLTIGRVRSDQPNDALAKLLSRQTTWQGGQMNVREVHVMSSELGRDGPTYTILSRAKLGSS